MEKVIIVFVYIGIVFTTSLMFGFFIKEELTFRQLFKKILLLIILKIKKIKIKRVIHKIDVAKHISNHLVGEHHTHTHRKIVGIIIMIIGVLIVKVLLFIDSIIVHLAGEIIGFAVHGIGLIPFATGLEHKLHEENKPIVKTLKYKLYDSESDKSTGHIGSIPDVQDDTNSNR